MESSTAPHSNTQKQPEKRHVHPNAILAVLMVGTFLAPLDSSIVNIALPKISTQLGAPLSSVSWVADAYLLTSVTLLLSMGRLGDMWGLRNLYVGGLLIFGAGSLACAFSPVLSVLVASRVLQASGAAMLFAAGPAMVARTFPPNKRGTALGIISLAVAAGLTAGPALGGFLVGAFGWPSIFWINVPLSVIAAAIAWRTLVNEESIGEKFDLLGAVLAGGALLSLLGALTEVEKFGPASVEILGALVVSLVLGLSFIWWERRVTHPMADLRLFKSAGFSAGLASALLSYMAMFSVTFTMPFFLLRARELPEMAAGAVLTLLPLAMALLAPYAGRLSDRIGSRVLSSVGLLVLTAGLIVASFTVQSTPLWFVAGYLFVVGAGMAIFQTPNTAAVLGATPRARHGVGSAFIAVARNGGMALGIAMTAGIVGWRMGADAAALTLKTPLSSSAATSLVAAMALAMRIAAVLAFAGVISSWFFRGNETGSVERPSQGG